jgi:hypothetical protein
LLVDISNLHARRLARMGAPTMAVPFGSSSNWYADLALERDIDVLWIGSHGSWRRSSQLNRIEKAFTERNIRFYKVDGRAAPFVHGEERTSLINRSKIVLNLMRTPYDDNTLRHFIAMPNRALVISEPMLRHNPHLLPQVHYVEAPLADLPDKILYYLEHEQARMEIVDRAYLATTGALSMERTIRRILSAVSAQINAAKIPTGS